MAANLASRDLLPLIEQFFRIWTSSI